MSHDMPSKRDVLLAQEARLVIALADVRSDLNRLLPISALPAEIFEQIFSTCISWLTHYPKRNGQRPEHPLAWTHVCRAWRNMALECPRLWQNIDLFALNTQLALTFLDRSGTSPISISAAYRLGTHAQRTSHLFLAFQPHAARLSSIDLSLFPDDIRVFFECVSWSELRNVSSLSLKVPPVSSNFRIEFPEPLPNLSKVTLDGVALPWNTCFQHGLLTHFSLSGLTADFSPTTSQLHSIFRVSSELQYLRLENISPSEDQTKEDGSSEELIPIELSKLQELVLTFSKAQAITSILSLISTECNPTPPSIQLSSPSFKDIGSLLPLHHLASLGSTLRLGKQMTKVLRSDTPAWTEASSDLLLSLTSPQSSTRSISPSPTRGDTPSITTPGVPKVDHPHLRFLLSPQLCLLLANLTSLELSMSILASATNPLPHPTGRMNLAQRKISSSPPSTRIVYASSAPQVTQDELRHFLSYTPNLESIHVALNDIDGLLYTFLRPPSSNSSNSNSSNSTSQPTDILCPKLTSLRFGSTGYLWFDFFTPPSPMDDDSEDTADTNWLQLLQSIISNRLKLHRTNPSTVSPITHLSFTRCEGINRDIVKQFFGKLAKNTDDRLRLVVDIVDCANSASSGESAVGSSGKSADREGTCSSGTMRTRAAAPISTTNVGQYLGSGSMGGGGSARLFGSDGGVNRSAPVAWTWWEQR